MKPSKAELELCLSRSPNWNLIQKEGQNRLVADFTFPNFQSSFVFLNEIARISEELDHHAEIWNLFNKVKLTLFTHVTGDISNVDLEFVSRVQTLSEKG